MSLQNVPLLTLIGSALALFAAALLLRKCARALKRDRSSRLGILAGVFGVALAFGTLLSHSNALLAPPSKLETIVGASGFVELKRADQSYSGPGSGKWISLADKSVDTKALVAESGKSGNWLLLDASHGVDPAQRDWVERTFGKLEELPRNGDSNATSTLCHHRSILFPLATGRCVDRPARYAVPPSGFDVARFFDGRAGITLRREGDSVIALSTVAIPAQPSPEEGCLQALGRGYSCAAIEALPAATLSAVVVRSIDNHLAKIFQEFGIPASRSQDDGLALYEGDSRVELDLDTRAEVSRSCGGLLGHKKIRAFRLERLEAALQAARTETDAKNALRSLDEIRDCPALALIDIPVLQLPKEVSALRSLLTQIRERPLWITTPESIHARFAQVDRVKIAWRIDDGSLWVHPESKLKDLALTVIANRPISDTDLATASLSDNGVALDVHRLTPSSFRLSFDELKETAGVRLDPKTWNQSPRSISAFLDWTGFLGAASCAFVVAALLSLFQSVVMIRSQSRAFYSGTFSSVFVIIFIWVFLGYRAALAPTGISASQASVERLPAPQHFFLREWPDSPSGSTTSLDQATDPWTYWTRNLASAKEKLKSILATAAGKVSILGVEKLASSAMPATGRIVLWDDARARNFFFRHSPEYRALVAGWEGMLRKRPDAFATESGSSVETVLKRTPDLLIVPDARFLSESDHKQLQTWVESGGSLVVSEGATTGAAAPPGAAQWLNATGFGATTFKSYTRMNLPGARVIELANRHRVVDTGMPYKGAAFGRGRAFFIGVSPLDSPAQNFLSLWLDGLMGARVAVTDSGKSCVTSALLEPWGADAGTLRAFAFSLRSQGIPVQWLVDPVSYAQVMPQWEKEFKRDGVVFRDDGTRSTRELAGLLASDAGMTDPSALVFAGQKSQAGSSTQGPGESALVRYVPFPGDTPATTAISQWRAECAYGVATPRLIGSDWVERGGGISEIFSEANSAGTNSGLSKEEIAPIATLVQALQKAERAPSSTRTRILVPDRLDPFMLHVEGTQTPKAN